MSDPEQQIRAAVDPCPECGEVTRLRRNGSSWGFFVACTDCQWTGPSLAGERKNTVCRICERRFSSRVSDAHLKQHGLTRNRYEMLLEGEPWLLRWLRARL